jgi:hypothetical protein
MPRGPSEQERYWLLQQNGAAEVAVLTANGVLFRREQGKRHAEKRLSRARQAFQYHRQKEE